MCDGEIVPMTDYEVALMDVLRTVLEVIVAKGLVSADTVDEMLEKQSQSYPTNEMPGALFVFETIRKTLTDPERGRVRELLSKPPEGSA